MPPGLFVGIGSPHGEDQVGWLVADQLAQLDLAGWQVRRATVPLDLLDWLEGIQHLAICDACTNLGQPGRLHRWLWPHPQIASCRSLGSHDYGIAGVLELAAVLKQLPAHVEVWGIETAADSPASDDLTAHRRAAEAIHAALKPAWPQPPGERPEA